MATWIELDHRGFQHVPSDATGPLEILELRRCECGSTLARPIDLGAVLSTLLYAIRDLSKRADVTDASVALLIGDRS